MKSVQSDDGDIMVAKMIANDGVLSVGDVGSENRMVDMESWIVFDFRLIDRVDFRGLMIWNLVNSEFAIVQHASSLPSKTLKSKLYSLISLFSLALGTNKRLSTSEHHRETTNQNRKFSRLETFRKHVTFLSRRFKPSFLQAPLLLSASLIQAVGSAMALIR